MTGAELANALGGRKVGRGWIARCPTHDDRKPSLSIQDAADGKLLVHCFGGCEQAQVIGSLRSRGLWEGGGQSHANNVRSQPSQSTVGCGDREDVGRTSAALEIWQEAKLSPGTPVETYLASRGICLGLPEALRFHGGLRHPSGGIWPVMVALVTRSGDDQPLAVHRTFLAHNGTGKAPVDPEKMMLGPCRGGAVRLGIVRPDSWLAIGEGIETTLSVMQEYRVPGWAALSEGGMRSLMLPPEATSILICADNDANGTGQRAAEELAERLLREGRRVRLAIPPEVGTDFNDVLNSALPLCLRGGCDAD